MVRMMMVQMVRMVRMVMISAGDGGSAQVETSTALLLRGVRLLLQLLLLLALLLHPLNGGLAWADDCCGVLVAL